MTGPLIAGESTIDEATPEARVAAMITAELPEDGVELWFVTSALRRQLPAEVTDEEVRAPAASVLRTVLGTGAVLGELTDTGDFVVWPDDDPVATAIRRWEELGRDPRMGEIGWLALPED